MSERKISGVIFSGDEKFLERIRQLEDELDKARFIQGQRNLKYICFVSITL